MFYRRETELQKSWFSGCTLNAALFHPVIDAKMALGTYIFNEAKARELRDKLENIFSEWQLNHGNHPLDPYYKDMLINDCPPYVCAGKNINDYADLLLKLRTEGFPLLLALDYEIGYQRVSALLVFSEAANSRIDSAIKAHWEIMRYKREQEESAREVTRKINEAASPLISIGVKSVTGFKRREDWQDKLDCQAIAETLWKKNPNMTITALENALELMPYKKKYPGRHTLRNWLSEIDLRPSTTKTGRPKKEK